MKKFLTSLLLLIFILPLSQAAHCSNAVVSLACNPENAATLSGDGTYAIGAKAEVTVSANPGFTFIGWTKGGELVSTSMVYQFDVTSDVELIANFDQNKWIPNSTTYSDNMSLIAIVSIDGIEQRDNKYEIGAFSGNEVRGSQRLFHEYIKNKAGDVIVDRYIAYLQIYGNDNDIITFKLYDHELDIEFDESDVSVNFINNNIIGNLFNPHTLSFTVPSDNVIFIGNGSWNVETNWNNSDIPTENDDVIINGNALISDEVTVNSIVIKEGKSLTIQDGGVLTVIETISNDDFDAFIIEDGGQIIQTNDNVAATFKKNIVNPSEQWGALDKTGWQFISSPIQNSAISDFAPQSGDYDLYKYDGTSGLQWYNYKKSTQYGFDNDFEGWTTIDADNDGFNWELNNGCLRSASYDIETNSPLSPDNYLISPMLNIDEVGSILKFKACAEDDYYPEYCGVFISENGTQFTAIEGAAWHIGEGLNEGELSEWYEKTVDLSDYKGMNIFVAIRHFNVEDSYYLLIDDIRFCRDDIFECGASYLASYESQTIAEFKGNLNCAQSYRKNANHSTLNIMANYNLFGNPFSYDINWTEDVKLVGMNLGYAVMKADGAYEYKTDGIIKVGEGFMVNSSNKGKNHNITFQKGINSSKNNITNNSINIVAHSKFGTDNIVVVWDYNNNSRFPKLDNFNDKIAKIYAKENDTIYGILNCLSDDMEIPIYFEAKEIGKYTLTFNVKGDCSDIYLLDKKTGKKINIFVDSEYTFMAVSNDNPDRFVLCTSTNNNEDFDNFAYINNGVIIISDINGPTTINIFDIMGRCVYNSDATDIISADAFSTGIYIIQKHDTNGVKAQKIIL